MKMKHGEYPNLLSIQILERKRQSHRNDMAYVKTMFRLSGAHSRLVSMHLGNGTIPMNRSNKCDACRVPDVECRYVVPSVLAEESQYEEASEADHGDGNPPAEERMQRRCRFD